MKRTFKTIVMAVVFLSVLFVSAACDLFDPPPERIEWIQVSSNGHQVDYKFNELYTYVEDGKEIKTLNIERLEIEVAYSSGREPDFLPVRASWISGYSPVTAGKQTITITYTHPSGLSSKSTTYEITMLPKQSATSMTYTPQNFYLGIRSYSYSGLVKEISDRAIKSNLIVKGDPNTRARIEVAANVANIISDLFFKNYSIGSELQTFMGPNGYSHGGTTPEIVTPKNMKAPTSASKNFARYIHTRTAAPEDMNQLKIWIEAGAYQDGNDREHRVFQDNNPDASLRNYYFEVIDPETQDVKYYMHHYYDEADFEGFVTKRKPASGSWNGYDSDNSKEMMYHLVHGRVRNRDIICNERCSFDTFGYCTVHRGTDKDNNATGLRYVQGFSDKLAEAVYNALGNVDSYATPGELYSSLSAEFAKITVEHFPYYFQSRYSSAERLSGTGEMKAREVLSSLFFARFLVPGTFSIQGQSGLGNLKTFFENRVAFHTTGVKRDMAEIVHQALTDVLAMYLTVTKYDAKSGSMMLEVGPRQIFGDGPMADQPFEILETGTLSFINAEFLEQVKMTFIPEYSTYKVVFGFGSAHTATPLDKILLTQYPIGVNVLDFAPVYDVLRDNDFSVQMRPEY